MSLTSMRLQQKKSSLSRMPRRLSFGVFLVVLLLVSACGTIPSTGSTSSGLTGTGSSTTIATTPKTSAPTAGATAQGATTPETAAQGTTAINATVTYASVKFTIVDMQQASSFADDNRTGADKPGALRIDLKEENTSKRGAGYYLPESVHLTMPDNTTIAFLNAQNATPPDALVSRTNWFDFAVPLTVDAKQLTLHFGTPTEAPIDVALTANSNVSKYQAKTAAPNKQVQYTNGNWTTNWTVTSASSQLSYNSRQAGTGMMYVVVSFKIDNPSAKDYGGYPTDIMRLKAGGAVSAPSDFTIPANMPAGTTNATGEVSFLVPQGSTDFTLTLLAGPVGAKQDVPIPFQIP